MGPRIKRSKREPRHATSGPFSVELLGQDPSPWAPRRHDDHASIFYAMRVRGRDGEHTVHRRYTDFEQLWNVTPQCDKFPEKSFFRIRFSKSFQAARMRDLAAVVEIAVVNDPFAWSQALRLFLGLVIHSPLDFSVPSSFPRKDCVLQMMEPVAEAIYYGAEMTTQSFLGDAAL